MTFNTFEKKNIRLDLYLFYIRMFKSRNLATKFIISNRLRISGQVTQKPHKLISRGDVLSLSIQDKASMIMHFMQMKLQWDMMSEEDKQKQKEEMKEKWKGLLTLTPEEKKQKLEEYAQTIKS